LELPNDDSYWDYLKIDGKGIRKSIDSNYLDIISSLDNELSPDEIPLVSEGHIKTPPELSQAALVEIYDKDPELIFNLACLNEFRKYKNEKVIEWKKTSVLDQAKEQIRLSDNPIIILYHIMKIEKNHLLDIMIRDMISRKSFRRFELTDTENDTSIFPISDMKEKDITKFLKKFDSGIGDKLKSYCWHIIHEKQFVEIYLRRATQPKYIELANKNVRQQLGKSIIIRISTAGLSAEMWAEKWRMAGQILDNIAENLFGDKARYKRERGYNSEEEVSYLVIALGKGNDSNMFLTLLERMNAPIIDSPHILLQKDEIDLSKAIAQLKGANIDLLTGPIHNIVQLGIKYEEEEYVLEIEPQSKGITIHLKGYRGPNEATTSLRNYFKEKYNLELTVGG